MRHHGQYHKFTKLFEGMNWSSAAFPPRNKCGQQNNGEHQPSVLKQRHKITSVFIELVLLAP